MSERNAGIATTAQGGMFHCKFDENWTVTYADDSLFRFLGYTKQEFEERFHSQMAGVIDPEDQKIMRKVVMEQLKTGNVIFNENRLRCKDGAVKWIWISAELRHDQPEPYFYCMFHDISQQKHMQDALARSERRYDTVFAQTQDVIFEWNCSTRVLYCSPNFEKKFGYPVPGENFPERVLQEGMIAAEDAPIMREQFRKLQSGKDEDCTEYRIRKADGTFLWCRIIATAVRDASGGLQKVIGMLSDIDTQKKQIQDVREKAMRDALTGLYNRNAAEEFICAYLANPAGPAALLVVDVDNFKGVNDTFGHIYGDAVLSDMAYHLQSLARPQDVVGRIGGDEFIVFIAGLQNRGEASLRAQKIGDVFHRSFQENELQYEISASIGIAFYPEDGQTYLGLFEKADTATYASKRNGKNRYTVYSPALSSIAGGHTLACEPAFVSNMQSQKNFRENITEYIFRIFYENQDISKAVPALFDLIGKLFGFSRVCVFERIWENGAYQNTFEWCAPGIASVKHTYGFAPMDGVLAYPELFDAQNMFTCEDIAQIEREEERTWLFARGVCSLMLCRVEDERGTAAFLGFEDCVHLGRQATVEERNAIQLVSQVISLFLMRARKQELLDQQQAFSQRLLRQVNACIYAISPQDFRLVFVNDQIRCHFSALKTGELCYQAIRGMDAPCKDCPMLALKGPEDVAVRELYHPKTHMWTETTASYIIWENGKQACLFSSNDITRYRADAARMDFLSQCIDGGMVGGYLKPGFPFYYINNQMLTYLGFEAQDEFLNFVDGMIINAIYPDDREQVFSTITAQLSDRNDTYEVSYRIDRKSVV